MSTVVDSPNRRLRREMGWSETVSQSRVRVGDWIGFSCGDLVREIDGRHVARVVAIISGDTVRVRWLDNNWVTDYDRASLVKVEAES